MYGFCRIIDLGNSHFNFSSKNLSSKVHTCFAEIVVLVTESTTKLGLRFLDFFTNWYWIYKSLENRAKLGRIFLCLGPWNFWNFTNIPLHLTPRPSGTNPLHNSAFPRRGKLAGGEVGPEEANKRGGWAIGLTCGRFGGGSDGEASGDGRRWGSGSTAAAARVVVKWRRC
jgi:hypothetical protein